MVVGVATRGVWWIDDSSVAVVTHRARRAWAGLVDSINLAYTTTIQQSTRYLHIAELESETAVLIFFL